MPVREIEEVYADLKKQGKKNVLVQCLLLMVGSEYREVIDAPSNGLNVKYCHPLLYYPENLQNAVITLESEFGNPADTATILCGHGNEHHLQYNAELVQIDEYLRANYQNSYLAVMEGTPEFGPVKEDVKSSRVTNVKFITFMLTCGDHMSNDVMGDEEDSLKSQLGLNASVTNGMASNPAIQQLYISRMKEMYKQFS